MGISPRFATDGTWLVSTGACLTDLAETHTQDLLCLHDGRIGTQPLMHTVRCMGALLVLALMLVNGALAVLGVGDHLVGGCCVTHRGRLIDASGCRLHKDAAGKRLLNKRCLGLACCVQEGKRVVGRVGKSTWLWLHQASDLGPVERESSDKGLSCLLLLVLSRLDQDKPSS